MKSAIVTGANGFVGSALVKQLLSRGFKVCAIIHANKDRLPDNPNLEVIVCDMSEIGSLVDKLSGSYDIFYHLAWAGTAGASRADYVLQLNNAKYALDSIRIAKELGCKRFVMAGTIMEHETYDATYQDGNKPGLGYIYGAGKTVAHMMAFPYAANMNIDLIWAKITNTYGPGESSPRLVNTTLRKCIDGISPEFTSGVQNYDFVYIDDVAEALYLIGLNGRPFNSYLIGSSNAKPLREFLMEMHDAVAPTLPFVFGNVPFTGVNMPLEMFDGKKTEDETGFKAKISFAKGCKMTYDWLKMGYLDDSKI